MNMDKPKGIVMNEKTYYDSGKVKCKGCVSDKQIQLK